VWYNDTMVVMLGMIPRPALSSSVFGDTAWVMADPVIGFNTTSGQWWTGPPAPSDFILDRVGFGTAIVGNKVYIYGGEKWNSLCFSFYGMDCSTPFVSLDLTPPITSQSWQLVQRHPWEHGGPRDGTLNWLRGDIAGCQGVLYLYVTRGIWHTPSTASMYSLDVEANQWTLVGRSNIQGQSLPQLVCDEARSRLLVFNEDRSLHSFHLADKTWDVLLQPYSLPFFSAGKPKVASDGAAYFLGDYADFGAKLWALNLSDHSVVEVPVGGDVTPRQKAASGMSPAGAFYVFGGNYASGSFSELWPMVNRGLLDDLKLVNFAGTTTSSSSSTTAATAATTTMLVEAVGPVNDSLGLNDGSISGSPLQGGLALSGQVLIFIHLLFCGSA